MVGLFVLCLAGTCGWGGPLPPSSPTTETPPTLSVAETRVPPLIGDAGDRRAATGEPTLPVAASNDESGGAATAPADGEPAAAPTPIPGSTPGASTDKEHGPSGGLSRAAVTDVVRGQSGSVRHCYEVGLANDVNFGGTVEMGWKIDLDGKVTSVNVVSVTVKNDAAEDCLLAEILRWEFPAAAERTVVASYPFVFEPGALGRHGLSERASGTSGGGRSVTALKRTLDDAPMAPSGDGGRTGFRRD